MKSSEKRMHSNLMSEEMHHDCHSDSEMYTSPRIGNVAHEKVLSHTKKGIRPMRNERQRLTFLLAAMKRRLEFIQMLIIKNSMQTTASFILGLVVGITIAAMLFQQNFIITGPQNKRNSVLTEGFVMHSSPGDVGAELDLDLELQHNLQAEEGKRLPLTGLNVGKDWKLQPPAGDKVVKNDIKTGSKVFVGVITAEKFLSTRAVAVNSTWGSQVDRVSFFTEKGTSEEYGISVVNLDGVSDKEYPPQKKAFNMLKYMCQHHLKEYDWFIRSDDDVYIRVEKLKLFLGQIDSNKMIYMGQPGHGVPEVRDKLGLNGHNFCMGGPSVIFNKRAMTELCPHLDECMTEVVSGEEDVEIGRCVSKHLHIECTHAWETLKLFYHSYQEEYTEEKPFLGNLAENIHVEKAITLHHVKLPYIMYKIHRHYMSLLLNTSTQAISYLHRQAHTLNAMLPFGKQRELSPGKIPPDPYKADRRSEVQAWNSFSIESVFALSYANPSDDITNDCLADLKQIGETAIDVAIDHSASHLTYSHMAGGYYRSDSLRGTDYLLDIYFSSKEQGKRDEVKRAHILRPLSDAEIANVEEYDNTDSVMSVYVVLAVQQSALAASDLEDYMRRHFEQAGLQGPFGQTSTMKTTLIVSMYSGGNSEQQESRVGLSPTIHDVVNWFRVRYPQSNIEALPKSANNGKEVVSSDEGYSHNARQAYTKGASHAIKLWDSKSHGVILLSSTNFTLSRQSLDTCACRSSLKINQEAGESNVQIDGGHFYQPVSFALFSPRESYEVELTPSEDAGYWFLSNENHDGDLNLPICGTIDNFNSITNYMQTDPNRNVIKAIYDSVYNFKYFLQRVPDKSIMYRYKR